MDATIEKIAHYVFGLRFEDLSDSCIQACKSRVMDSIGCGLGSVGAGPVNISKFVAQRAPVPRGACLLGGSQKVLPELAAFSNGVMIRYLDGNDTFPGGGGHPSDVIAPTLAMAQYAKADGKAFITATVAAYEIYQAFFRGGCMRDKGLDHVFYTAVASAVAAGKLLNLSEQKLKNAISLAVTPNIALHTTRRGDLSMWKGVAAPNAARNGVFAALLAEKGMTGPENAIEGSHGLRELLGKFELGSLANKSEIFAIENSNLKFFLSEYHSQSPIAHALELSHEVLPELIKKITIHTYWFAWSEIGSEPEKWHPTTRESADHSLPFIVAAVIRERAFSDAIFGGDRLNDPEIHKLADKVAVVEDPSFTAIFSKKIPCRVVIELNDGRILSRESEYPRGHVKNPMTVEEIEGKFKTLASRVISSEKTSEALRLLRSIEDWSGFDELFHALESPLLN